MKNLCCCSNINDPYAKLCVPDIVKNLTVRVFSLMPRTNEKRHIEWYETCKCKCRLDGGVCNKKQRWKDDKCRCECKELMDKDASDKGFIWNPSNCECECGKSCDVGEHLDYENCKRIKKLVDKLVEKCTKNIEKVKLAKKTSAEDENKHKGSSCTLYICALYKTFLVNIGIGIYFIYKYINHAKNRC